MKEYNSMYISIVKLKKIILAANSIAQTLILDEALEKIVNATCDCLNCERATVFILDEEKK